MEYTSATSNETKSKKVRASTQYLEIDGLEENSNYTIAVMASNSKGYGPASELIFVATDQNSTSLSALTFTNELRSLVNHLSCSLRSTNILQYECNHLLPPPNFPFPRANLF